MLPAMHGSWHSHEAEIGARPAAPAETHASPAAREASQLLDAFAHRTGLDGPPARARRYLWTDACAVTAWVNLHAQSGPGAGRDLDRAQQLVEQVHATLARHRFDDGRAGPISGLPESEAVLRPTAGGLRIGKPLPERRTDEAYNEQLEWDRDGQYFHYNARWMHALDALARATGDERHLRAAIELAVRSVQAFAHGGVGSERLFWKMSIDLSRPLVPAMGQHDAIDGLLALERLRASALRLGVDPSPLSAPIARLRAMCAQGVSCLTGDPLGIGGLLADIALAIRLTAEGAGACDATREPPSVPPFERVLADMLADAPRGLAAFEAERIFRGMPPDRLAFRELGLAIGLRKCDGLSDLVRGNAARFGSAAMVGAIVERLAAIDRRAGLAARLEDSWRGVLSQATASWQSHRDINEAMLAEALSLRDLPPERRW